VFPSQLGILAGLALVLLASSATATLREDAQVIDAELRAAGLDLQSRQTVFLEESRVVEVAMTPTLRCRSIVIVAARNVSFVAVTGSLAEDADELMTELASSRSSRRRESEAGLLQLSACGDEARELDRVFVRMASARGALEIRVAGGSTSAKDLLQQLGRSAGPSAPRGDPGPPLPVTALLERRERAESAARADGATNVLRTLAQANLAGSGEIALKAVTGCHRFQVMADSGERLADVDAELRDADTGARLGRDRGETPDARLETCVARTTDLTISFAGAPPGSSVVVQDALFALPKGIPEHWGSRAQAGLAHALRRRLRRGPSKGPIFETIGAQGTTATTMAVESGRCYVASLALLRGSSRGLRLIASASARASFEEVPPASEAAAITFCAERHETARLHVDVPGAGMSWVLAVWLMGDGT